MRKFDDTDLLTILSAMGYNFINDDKSIDWSGLYEMAINEGFIFDEFKLIWTYGGDEDND